MTTHALIPTELELGILTADKPLLAILRPMEPQPIRGQGGRWYWPNECDDYDTTEHLVRGLLLSRPYAPGDVIAWQEKWWKHWGGLRKLRAPKQSYTSRVMGRWVQQPAATMPEHIARYRSTVAECRPVKLTECPLSNIVQLGYSSRLRSIIQFENTWDRNNPKHPFASSWAWWIDLDPKGKSDADETD